ncbi:MAG: VCBS repeat-containing protein, partial [Candidatus Omnitrophica bacterium]|nr:VCBS repeat-containing protein [Candidatus Omnitrophota bacterium]
MTRHASWLQRGVASFTAAALGGAQLVLPPQAEASHLGSTTASAGSVPPPGVSTPQSFQPDLFTGRATTSIPIVVPPGRKGMQPSLALAYSSSGRNGWVGVGWGLDLGYIERSTKNGVPKYDASDTYTFMFQGVASDLVRIPDGTYRAKDEGLFLRFEDRGISGWEVRDKAGTRYVFGRDVNSQLDSGGRTFRWCLDTVIDPNGNTLALAYTKDRGQLYPSQIDYTGHEPTRLAPTNRVTFLLEDRPDDEVSYRSGFAVTTAKRLKEIAAYAPDPQGQPLQLARKYALVYTTSGRTGRSLLASVQQFGTDGTTSLPATTLTYQSTGAASYPNILNNFASPPSVAGWNVRKAGLDTGHETWGCAHPYLGLPWGSPSVASGNFNLGCLAGGVSSNGDVTMSGCNDHFGHVWTYVYVGQAKTISLSHSSSNDAVGCLYREDAGGVTQITNPGSISLSAGWSILHITAYHQHQGWGPTTLSGGLKNQVDVMNPSQIILGVPQLAGDVNGDAKTDIIKFTPSSGSWTVSCATSCTLPPGGAWLSGFGNSSSTPLLGDWNGDGKTDVAIFTSGTWRFATSTGTSFQADTIGQVNVGSGTPLTGDFNGDAITDIGSYNNGSWSIALGTGSGFSSTGSFSLSWGDSGYEALTGDFNGDGLTDIGIINRSSGAIDVRLSTGSNWTGANNWIGGFGGANPHTSADFNGDGLTDAAYYNRSAGQVIYAPSTGSGFGSPVTLPLAFSLTSSDDTIQVGDFNGDGIADPAAFNILSGSSQLALSSLTNPDGSNGTATDLLRTIQNGVGGTTTLTYQPSTLCGCGQDPLLPFMLHVVQQATSSDGLGHSYTTTYLFHGGLYDAPTKEFRGFAKATVFDVDGNKSITEFHQDAQKKGRPFRTEFRDQDDALCTKQEQTWSSIDPYPGVHFVTLDQTDAYTYDGDATFRQTRSRFEYDAFGNVTKTREFGD